MTCKDCLYHERCHSVIAYDMGRDDLTGEYFADIETKCKSFKNKADFIEVVRCKDCEHYVANYCTRDIKGRTNMFYMTDNDYCSYGERKEGAEE